MYKQLYYSERSLCYNVDEDASAFINMIQQVVNFIIEQGKDYFSARLDNDKNIDELIEQLKIMGKEKKRK